MGGHNSRPSQRTVDRTVSKRMDKEAVLEIFRKRCVRKIVQSLDRGIEDEGVIFRRLLQRIESSCDHERSLMLALMCKYLMAGDMSFSSQHISSYCVLLADMKRKCLENNDLESGQHGDNGEKIQSSTSEKDKIKEKPGELSVADGNNNAKQRTKSHQQENGRNQKDARRSTNAINGDMIHGDMIPMVDVPTGRSGPLPREVTPSGKKQSKNFQVTKYS